MNNTLKIFENIDNETIEKALSKTKGSDTAKARALKEINDYKYIRAELKKMFNK